MSMNTATVTGGTLVSKDGGDLELDPDSPMEAPGDVQSTDYGVAFGPLELIAYPDSTARVGGLAFKEEASILEGLFGSGDDGSLFGLALLASTGAVAADGDEDAQTGMTRRDILRAGALGVGLVGGAAGAASVQAQTSTYPRASFAALDNPAGIRVRVLDRVDSVLPPTQQYYTHVDGRAFKGFSPSTTDSYGDVLPEKTGTVTVGPEGAGEGILSRIKNDRTQTYESLTLPKATSDAEAGEELTISTNDIIVETVQNTGASNTICTINGVSIPHRHEDSGAQVGHYSVSDGELVYQVGSSPPAGQTATIVVYASRTQELFDDVSRVGD